MTLLRLRQIVGGVWATALLYSCASSEGVRDDLEYMHMHPPNAEAARFMKQAAMMIGDDFMRIAIVLCAAGVVTIIAYEVARHRGE